MNLKNNQSGGIDITKYKYIVRGYEDIKTMFKPNTEEFVTTREELDSVVNNTVSKGYCVVVIPTYMIDDDLSTLRSGVHI
jgi:hypothetical protein